MLDGDQVQKMMNPLIRRDVQKMVHEYAKRMELLKHKKTRRRIDFSESSILKRAISPLLIHSYGASQDDGEEFSEQSDETEESSEEIATETSPETMFDNSTIPPLPNETKTRIFNKLVNEHYHQARGRMMRRKVHSDLQAIGKRQTRSLKPYFMSKAKQDLPGKLQEEWKRISQRHDQSVATAESNLHQEIQKFIKETLTPKTALNFARSENVKYLFTMLPMTSSDEIGTEKETIRARIAKDVTLLCAFRFVMLKEKKYEKKVIMANLNEAVRKILRNIYLIKTHFQPGEFKNWSRNEFRTCVFVNTLKRLSVKT